MCELTKDSRTTSRKIDYAEAKMQTMKKELDPMFLADFLPNLSPLADGSIMAGCHGDNSLQKV